LGHPALNKKGDYVIFPFFVSSFHSENLALQIDAGNLLTPPLLPKRNSTAKVKLDAFRQ
jgi:hypothetical protein